MPFLQKTHEYTRNWSFFLLIALTLAGCRLVDVPETTENADFGKFVGDVVTRWDPNGRDMYLIQSFEYVDGKGKVWRVPAGAPINGATIPESLWSIVGSPYVGKYRYASVVHDYFTDAQTESWEDVHKMFYEASRAGGVEESQAKYMYAAVYRYGPRWTVKNLITTPTDKQKDAPSPSETIRSVRRPPAMQQLPANPEVLKKKMQELKTFIQTQSPNLYDIEQFMKKP